MSEVSNKYKRRPSPPIPANNYCNQIKLGNDGNMYISLPDKNGVCKWKRHIKELLKKDNISPLEKRQFNKHSELSKKSKVVSKRKSSVVKRKSKVSSKRKSSVVKRKSKVVSKRKSSVVKRKSKVVSKRKSVRKSKVSSKRK